MGLWSVTVTKSTAAPSVDQNTTALYALTHAQVIPIEPPGILKNYTVIINQGQIVNMGPDEQVQVPSNAKVVDLHGQYLLPGFSDMHVHLTQHKDLLQFLKHGVTRVRNMAAAPDYAYLLGVPHVPSLKKALASGQTLGPDLTGCGLFLDGDPPQNSLTTVIHSEAEAKALVKNTVAAGYDCVKVYNRLQKNHFEAALEESQKWGIPLMGHVPFEVGLSGALKAPMRTIEHLNAYIDNFAGTYRIPPEQWAQKAQETAQAEVYNCPTLVIWDQHPVYGHFEYIEQNPRFAQLPWALQWFWRNSLNEVFDVSYPDKAGYAPHILQLSLPMVKALYDNGAPLLIGTDANFTGIYPGWSALREMELFAQAGIPNAAILEAATLNAAKVLHLEQTEGSIAVGKRAQLVVLNENPLANIQAVHSTVGIMVQGRWFTVDDINQRLML